VRATVPSTCPDAVVVATVRPCVVGHRAWVEAEDQTRRRVAQGWIGGDPLRGGRRDLARGDARITAAVTDPGHDAELIVP